MDSCQLMSGCIRGRFAARREPLMIGCLKLKLMQNQHLPEHHVSRGIVALQFRHFEST